MFQKPPLLTTKVLMSKMEKNCFAYVVLVLLRISKSIPKKNYQQKNRFSTFNSKAIMYVPTQVYLVRTE